MKVAVLMLVVAMAISANAGPVEKRFFWSEVKKVLNNVDDLTLTYNSAKAAFKSATNGGK